MTDFSLEKAAMARGCAAVCGCDEAGAGPLMGPVYAAAVKCYLCNRNQVISLTFLK